MYIFFKNLTSYRSLLLVPEKTNTILHTMHMQQKKNNGPQTEVCDMPICDCFLSHYYILNFRYALSTYVFVCFIFSVLAFQTFCNAVVVIVIRYRIALLVASDLFIPANGAYSVIHVSRKQLTNFR